MEINTEIFKNYDIRGIYPRELNEKTSFYVGWAFVKFLKKKKPKIVIGRDNRLSSSKLFSSLVKGILSQGAEITDVGLVTTPMLYWACAYYKFDGGMMITASHNPPEYNGFKLVREKSIPISKENGLEDIKKIILRTKKIKQINKGKIIKKEIIEDYLNFNFKAVNFSVFTPSLKVVIDTANAVAGVLVPYLKRKLPFKIYCLFEELNGRFPNHHPDPLIKENLIYLQKAVKNKKADLGVAFDGDGDRILFVDEKGENISGDLITTLIAKTILKKKKREKILFDIRSSNIVKEIIKKSGGIPIMGRIGHSLIKEKMRKENIFFAGEFSGHYYHKEHYFCECPLFILFKMLEIIFVAKKPISKIIKPLKKYFHSGEINLKIKDKEKVIKKLENIFSDGKVSKIDGLRIDFNDWWFLARPSGTENLLRLVIEAKTKKLMEEKKKEILQYCSLN